MKASSCALLLCAQCMAGAAQAGDLLISGFGTIGIEKTNTDQAQFVRYNQAKGVTTTPGFGTDTNLGLQANYSFNDQLSATVQVLTRLNTSTRFTPGLTWAFLKARLSDDLELRVGRTAIPIFMISDVQQVGFANTMMRPPIELYGQAPLESADGADLLYQHTFGATTVSGQLGIGSSSGKLFVPAGGGAIANYRAPLATLSLSAEHGPFMLRLMHLRTRFNSTNFAPLNSVVNAVTSLGLPQLGQDLSLVGGKRISFSAVGLNLNWRKLLVQAEFGRRRNGEPVYIPENDAWYAMIAYRSGKWLPYYSHADVRQTGVSVMLPPAFPAAGPLHDAVVTGFLTLAQQTTNAIGVRWNVAESASFKLQVDRIRPKTKSGALIFGPAGGLHRPITAVGVTLDYTF
jgi:hypothetical protein